MPPGSDHHAKIHRQGVLHGVGHEGDNGEAERQGRGRPQDRYVTTGPSDFQMIISIDDVSSLLAGLMVAGGAGAIANIETQRAFTSEEFTEMQKKAAKMAASYSAPA